MLRSIASMASSGRGLGIVSAVVTVLGLVGGAGPRIIVASVLHTLAQAAGNLFFCGTYGCVVGAAQASSHYNSTRALQTAAGRASAARRAS